MSHRLKSLLLLLAVLAGAGLWRVADRRMGAFPTEPQVTLVTSEPRIPKEVRQGVKGKDRVLIPGWRYRYLFDLDTRAIGGVAGEPDVLHTGWSGTLDLTYAGAEGGQQLFQGRVVLTRVEMERGGTQVLGPDAQQLLRVMLERPVYVAQDTRGRVLAVHFPPTVDTTGRRFVRALLAATQFVAEDGSTWSTEESDTTGDFESEYRAGGSTNTYVKTKRRYLRSAAPGTPPRLKGHLAFTLFEDGHVKEAAGSDVMEVSGTGRLETRVALTGVGVDRQPLSLGDFQAVRSTLKTERLAVAEPAEASTPAGDRQLVGGATSAELLRLLARATQPHARDATRARLAALFRLEPAELERATRMVRQGTASPELAGQLLEALGSAGTPESQRALVSVLEEARVRAELRTQAARVASRVQTPTLALAAALELALDGARDEEVKNAAALAVGAVVKGLEPMEPARSRELLEGVLKRCQARSVDPVVCLKTLANAGSPRGLAYAKSSLLHPSTKVRDAAMDALRTIPGAEADALLDEVLLGDPSPRVRTQAVAAMSHRVAGPHMKALSTALRLDSSAQVRMEVVRLLGGLKTVDELAVALLRDVAENDVSEEVRRLAASMLAG
ncbi:HEAT repeat domain-containing protein [Pyxidicoccus xibeiensis]|uniref:HEAT repeat domain-containing protein n=1 Tax=Pyxidicoccus xibeiensis TaxID=2906759 RepID=UPI0020A7AA59|nr:HEAT repeat domain-containing protein [Pyxidicoccus xibeiensis]MCP3137105.1 HEAT repeat domain-containing protein [Pyxidicoccus xibeiensis]